MTNMLDKMNAAIANAVLSKTSFDPVKVAKKFKFKVSRDISDGAVSIVVGNNGKVFDGIIIANNKSSGQKALIFIRKDSEEQFKMILGPSTDNDLQDYVDAANNNTSNINGKDVSKYMKNKSLKITLLVERIEELIS